MRTYKFLPILFFALTVVVTAQDFSPIQREINNLARADASRQESLIANIRDSVIRVKLIDSLEADNIEADNLVADGTKVAQKILAFRRADIQSGSSSGGSGSTSTVISPLLPAIFGISFENGAITRSVSGSTISLNANPAGLFCASGADSQAVALRDDDACRTFWKRFGITAAFDTSRGEKKSELANLQTLDNQLSELTVRIELLNHRTLSKEKFTNTFKKELGIWREDVKKFADESAKAAAGSYERDLRREVERSLLELVKTDSYRNAETEERVGQIEDKIRNALNMVIGNLENVKTRRQLWLDSLKSNERLQSAVLNALVITAEYSLQRPDIATEAIEDIVPAGVRPPDLHSVRFIAAKGIGNRKLDITANASASFFSETRPGMDSTFRDFRFDIQGEFRLRDIDNWGAPTLSFSGLYVYLNQEPLGLGILTFNQTEIQDRGHIGLFQAKFEMPTANNAVRVPLSFTYSNRTELIKESDARGQIGISFNLDSLFGK